MKLYKFRSAYIAPGEWQSPAFVQCDAQGKIRSISGKKPPSATIAKTFDGILIPGVPNAHCHVFQRYFAGLTEYRDRRDNTDDFWSWRTAMYRYASQITPDQLREIAIPTYKKMLSHGYTSVCEFHYIHHAPDGKPYKDRAEMSVQIMEAAKAAGIRLTLLPVFYERSNFGVPAESEQRRFISKDIEEYGKLVEAIENKAKKFSDVVVGRCAHSLRAVDPEMVKELYEASPQVPFHIHVAEQQKEVEACQKYLNARPVEWILRNFDCNDSLNLVHATHITLEETRKLAQTQAHAVLCPTTEANLGDGVFPLPSFLAFKGKIAIGSDSNVCLSPWEEIRWLDYVQRLLHQIRQAMVPRNLEGEHHEIGDLLFDWVVANGRSSCGRSKPSYFPIGDLLEGFVVTPPEQKEIEIPLEKTLSWLVFAQGSEFITASLVGNKVVNYK